MGVLPVCISATCVQCLWKPEEGIEKPGIRITDGYGPMNVWAPGIEPRSSESTTSVLNHCTISLLHPFSYCSLNYPAVIWVGDAEGNLHQDKAVPEEVSNQSACGVMDLEVVSTSDVYF